MNPLLEYISSPTRFYLNAAPTILSFVNVSDGGINIPHIYP